MFSVLRQARAFQISRDGRNLASGSVVSQVVNNGVLLSSLEVRDQRDSFLDDLGIFVDEVDIDSFSLEAFREVDLSSEDV